MLPDHRGVLKAGPEGELGQTPLPLLLNAIRLQAFSGALELRRRQLEKRLLFEEGELVGCTSNLLHETLGKFLVERGKLTEQQFQAALNESISAGTRLGEHLVHKGLISSYDLYKQLQANLAFKVLECFRWDEGAYRIRTQAEEAENPLRLRTARLIYLGCTLSLPFDVVSSHFPIAPGQRFAQAPQPSIQLQDLKLPPKDARLLQALRHRPLFAELCERCGMDTEATMRRLFALSVLGLALPEQTGAEGAPPAPPRAAEPESPEPEVKPAPTGIAYADEDEALKNALATEYLEHRRKDPFDLLAVPVEASGAAFREAFLKKVDPFFSPRFRGAELREQAEALLAAYAQAYGALSDPDRLALFRQRRAVAKEKQQAAPRPSAAEQFRIRTDLLDARSQFEEGKRRLAEGNLRSAMDYFTYAADIEPKGAYRAHLAWARYKFNPQANAKLALHELLEVCRSEPGCEEGWAFLGELHLGSGTWAEADAAFRRAFKLNPQNKRYPEVLRELAKKVKPK